MKKILLTLTLISLSTMIKTAPNKDTATLTIKNQPGASITAFLYRNGDPVPKGYSNNTGPIDSNKFAAFKNSEKTINIPLKSKPTPHQMVYGTNEYETWIKIQTNDGKTKEYSVSAKNGTFKNSAYIAQVQPDGSLKLLDEILQKLSNITNKKKKSTHKSDIEILEIIQE